jgi:hypothetical protein
MKPISTGTAPHYAWGAKCDGWHLVRSADLSVIQERMPPAHLVANSGPEDAVFVVVSQPNSHGDRIPA